MNAAKFLWGLLNAVVTGSYWRDAHFSVEGSRGVDSEKRDLAEAVRAAAVEVRHHLGAATLPRRGRYLGTLRGGPDLPWKQATGGSILLITEYLQNFGISRPQRGLRQVA